MLRRGIVLDISVALGLGTSAGYLWWYGEFCSAPFSSGDLAIALRLSIRMLMDIRIGFHIPQVRRRDNFYAKLEQERADNL